MKVNPEKQRQQGRNTRSQGQVKLNGMKNRPTSKEEGKRQVLNKPRNKQDAGANNQGHDQIEVEQNSKREGQDFKVTLEVKLTSTEKNTRKADQNQENPENKQKKLKL